MDASLAGPVSHPPTPSIFHSPYLGSAKQGCSCLLLLFFLFFSIRESLFYDILLWQRLLFPFFYPPPHYNFTPVHLLSLGAKYKTCAKFVKLRKKNKKRDKKTLQSCIYVFNIALPLTNFYQRESQCTYFIYEHSFSRWVRWKKKKTNCDNEPLIYLVNWFIYVTSVCFMYLQCFLFD